MTTNISFPSSPGGSSPILPVSGRKVDQTRLSSLFMKSRSQSESVRLLNKDLSVGFNRALNAPQGTTYGFARYDRREGNTILATMIAPPDKASKDQFTPALTIRDASRMITLMTFEGVTTPLLPPSYEKEFGEGPVSVEVDNTVYNNARFFTKEQWEEVTPILNIYLVFINTIEANRMEEEARKEKEKADKILKDAQAANHIKQKIDDREIKAHTPLKSPQEIGAERIQEDKNAKKSEQEDALLEEQSDKKEKRIETETKKNEKEVEQIKQYLSNKEIKKQINDEGLRK